MKSCSDSKTQISHVHIVNSAHIQSDCLTEASMSKKLPAFARVSEQINKDFTKWKMCDVLYP